MTPAALAWDEGRVEDFLALAAAAPDDPEAQGRRVWLTYMAGEWDEAERVFEAALRSAEAQGPEAVYTVLDVAAGPVSERARHFERGLRLGAEAHLPEARIARMRARLARARAELGEVRVARETLGPERPAWWWWDVHGHVAMYSGDAATAEAAFTRAIASSRDSRRPDQVVACANGLVRVGAFEFMRGDLEGAMRAYEEAIGRCGSHRWARTALALAWNGMGEVHRWRGDLDAAERAYLTAAELAPHISMYTLNRAIVDLERGRHAEAAARIEAIPRLQWMLAAPVALVRAACAAATGDGAAFDRAVRPLAEGRVRALADVDIARLARLAAGRAARHRGWGVRAARLRSVALRTWTTLGRSREAADDARALRRLADQGAPVPLGPYALERPVGRGGFGEVWRARDDSGASVAVKVFDRATAVDALERELRAVAGLDHPCVVRLLDHGRVDAGAATMAPTLRTGTPWMATEWFDGTLEPLLGRAPWGTARRILLALLDALAHAHARGILHLDVKPANVLVRGEATCLADFGLARAFGAEGTTAGTPLYMAPEQFAGGRLGPWTDLYALGGLAASLASGRAPFEGASVADLRRAHLSAAPRIEAAVPVPDGFGAWVSRLLARSPADRFRTAAQAARALHALAGPVVGGASVPPPRSWAAPTIPLDALAEEGPLPAPTDDLEVAALPPPAVPASWDTGPAVRGRPQGAALFGLRAVPFVARRAERTRLWSLLRDVVATGTPRAATLRGPPGAGASALAAWCCERAAEVGAAEPIRVRAAGGVWRAVDLASPADAAGVLRDALADPPVLGPLERRRVVARHLASRGVPVVLWLDGAAVDADALGLVAELLASRVPALVLLSGGTGAVVGECLDLGPLDPEGMRELLLALLPFQPRELDRVAEVVGGDTGFAVQLVTDLVERDRLEFGADSVTLRIGIALPRTLAELWAERVGSISFGLRPDERDALAVAAVLGPSADDAEWEAACRHAGLPFAPGGREALVSARLARADRRGWAFADAIRAALVGAADTRQIDGACAAALREIGGDPARIGAHEAAAGRPGEAFEAWRVAMLDRARAGHSAEVEVLATRILALDLPPPADVAARIAVERARCRFLLDSDPASVAVRMHAAAAAAERAGLGEDMQDLALNALLAEHRASRVDVRPRLRAIVAAAVTPRVRMRALFNLARIAEMEGPAEEARALFQEGCALADEVGGHEAVWLHHGYGWHLATAGHLEEALARLARARDGESGVNLAIIRRGTGVVLRALGRYAEAEHELLVAEETVDAIGRGDHAAVARLDRALIRYATGRDAEGDALVELALETFDPGLGTASGEFSCVELVYKAVADDAAFEPVLARVVADATSWTLWAGLSFACAARRAEAAGFGDRAARIRALGR